MTECEDQYRYTLASVIIHRGSHDQVRIATWPSLNINLGTHIGTWASNLITNIKKGRHDKVRISRRDTNSSVNTNTMIHDQV